MRKARDMGRGVGALFGGMVRALGVNLGKVIASLS